MIYAIAYSNEMYENPKKWNLESALENGADVVISYSPSDIDEEFYGKNRRILDCSRGNGYWIWKPYFVLKTLNEMQYGDYLVYADAGSAYVNDIKFLLMKMEANNDEIMVFDQSYIECEWTKRDAFVLMDCDREEYYNSHQVMATFIVLKKTGKSVRFVEEWLAYCEDERIVTDNENVMGLENYPGFVENRHDQTVLSLLAKKWKLRVYEDPSHLLDIWFGEPVDLGNKIWLSHRTPYVRDLNDLVKVNRKYVEQYLPDGKKTIIYGAGFRGKLFCSYVKRISREIDAFVVSTEKHIMENAIAGIRVYSMESFPFELSECRFVVTVQAKEDEIADMLDRMNAEYVIFKDYNRKEIFSYWKELNVF